MRIVDRNPHQLGHREWRFYICAGKLTDTGELGYVDREGVVREYDGSASSFFYATEEEAELAMAKALLIEQRPLRE